MLQVGTSHDQDDMDIEIPVDFGPKAIENFEHFDQKTYSRCQSMFADSQVLDTLNSSDLTEALDTLKKVDLPHYKYVYSVTRSLITVLFWDPHIHRSF